MEGQVFIKPSYLGLIIRDPISKAPLSEDGEYKPWKGKEGVYWRRRLEEGSIKIIEPIKKEDEKRGGKKQWQ